MKSQKFHSLKLTFHMVRSLITLLTLSILFSCAAIEAQQKSREYVAYLNEAEDAYAVAEKMNTVEAYEWVIEEYPKALLTVDKAKEQLAKLNGVTVQDLKMTNSSLSQNSNPTSPSSKDDQFSFQFKGTQEQVIASLVYSIKYNYESGKYYKAFQTIKALKTYIPNDDIPQEILSIADDIESLRTSDPDVANIFKDNEYHLAKYWDGTYCYIDNQGEVILNGDYEEASPFSEGLARVTINKKDVFIDYDGNVVIDLPQTDQTRYFIKGSFHNGFARCLIKDSDRSLNGDCFIDKKGNEQMTFLASNEERQVYSNLTDFSEGYAAVWYGSDRLAGYIDTKGNWLIEPTFKDAEPFQDGMAKILYPNKENWGYIDTSGEVKIRPKYKKDWCGNFSEGLALVIQPEYGYINKDGELIINIEPYTKGEYAFFDSQAGNEFSNGFAGITIAISDWDRQVSYFDLQGNEILRYGKPKPNAGIDWHGNHFTTGMPFSEGYSLLFDQWQGWRIFDHEGNIKVASIGAVVNGPFTDGIAPVEAGVERGYINVKGEIVYYEEW